jgi:hypothetical protein
MNEMQKSMVNTEKEKESPDKDNLINNSNNSNTNNNLNTNNITNNSNITNNITNSTNLPNNPFVETFREMNENQMNNNLSDLLKLFENSGDMKIPEGETGDIKNLYDILGKLSDNKDHHGEEPDKAKLESLFGDLLEFLLKSDMLAEPLSQIKNSVTTYLEKNKDKLNAEQEEKYKSMLSSIDTILCEIQKKEPNKALVIEIFYKLHELSDIDSEILPQGDATFKQFSDLFGSKN